jgi:hypothetical protein
LAYATLFGLAPLYVMFSIRDYWNQQPIAFSLTRYAECLQYAIPVSLFFYFLSPVDSHDLGELVWSRALPVWLGLNFSVLDRPPFKGIACTTDGWRKNALANVLLVFGFMILLCAQIWLSSDFIESTSYGAKFACLIVLALLGEVLRMLTMQKKDIHVHHYYVGIVASAFCWGSHLYSVFLAHLFLGVYIEGLAAWGRDPVFLASS